MKRAVKVLEHLDGPGPTIQTRWRLIVETIISRPTPKLSSPSVIQDRIARARRLLPDQVEVALVFLAGYDGDTFNEVMAAAEAWNDGLSDAARFAGQRWPSVDGGWSAPHIG